MRKGNSMMTTNQAIKEATRGVLSSREYRAQVMAILETRLETAITEGDDEGAYAYAAGIEALKIEPRTES
jgi:hypothetical protein